jgi:uncharacterized protein YndB with AHSA1/START domain
MNIRVGTTINAPTERVWAAVSDIEHRSQMLSGIVTLRVLERPASGLIGLKWSETRVMFGQEAAETMTITEAEEGRQYTTRAESHGSVYLTKIEVTEVSGGQTNLAIVFDAKPQSAFARVVSLLMAPLITGSTTKALRRDLDDIRRSLESGN